MSDSENETGANGENAATGAQTTTTDTDQGDKSWEESTGSGGKTAVLADLHKERTQRQQLANENAALKAFKDGLTKLIGGGQDDLDPKELAGKLTASESRATTAERLLDVFRTAPVGTDVSGLTDSLAFRTGLAAAEDVPAYVKTFLKDNPRFLGDSTGTVKNLHQGNGGGGGKQAPTMNDILRGNA